MPLGSAPASKTDRVRAALGRAVEEGGHGPAVQGVDGQAGRAGLAHGEVDARGRVEGVGVVLPRP